MITVPPDSTAVCGKRPRLPASSLCEEVKISARLENLVHCIVPVTDSSGKAASGKQTPEHSPT